MTRQFEQYSAYTPMHTTTTASAMTGNRTTEKPVSGMRVWDIDYVKSVCPHCGWWDNRKKLDGLLYGEVWECWPIEQVCASCGMTYEVVVDDDSM